MPEPDADKLKLWAAVQEELNKTVYPTLRASDEAQAATLVAAVRDVAQQVAAEKNQSLDGWSVVLNYPERAFVHQIAQVIAVDPDGVGYDVNELASAGRAILAAEAEAEVPKP